MTSAQGMAVSTSHPMYKQVAQVAQRIVDSNSDIEFFRTMQWKVTVLKGEDANAFVLPVSTTKRSSVKAHLN